MCLIKCIKLFAFLQCMWKAVVLASGAVAYTSHTLFWRLIFCVKLATNYIKVFVWMLLYMFLSWVFIECVLNKCCCAYLRLKTCCNVTYTDSNVSMRLKQITTLIIFHIYIFWVKQVKYSNNNRLSKAFFWITQNFKSVFSNRLQSISIREPHWSVEGC